MDILPADFTTSPDYLGDGTYYGDGEIKGTGFYWPIKALFYTGDFMPIPELYFPFYADGTYLADGSLESCCVYLVTPYRYLFKEDPVKTTFSREKGLGL